MLKDNFLKIELSKYTDTELLMQYSLKHDQLFLAELYNRYLHLVLLVCQKYLSDKDSAYDMTMSIYEKLIEILKYQKVKNFKSWIYSVARNEALMLLRKNDALNKKVKIFNLDIVESDEFIHQEDEVYFTNDILYRKIEELAEEQRECIEHFYFKKLSYKEIAKLFSISEKKVKSRLQNGKRNLKSALLKAVE